MIVNKPCLEAMAMKIIDPIALFGMYCICLTNVHTVKPMQNGHSQKDRKLVFKTNYRLMQVKSIAECSKRSILQYF